MYKEAVTPSSPDLRAEMVALLPRLRRFTRSLALDPEAGDDLAQATIERALAGLAGFQLGTRLDSWMYRIAQNLWIDSKRSARGRAITVPIENLVDMAGDDGRRVTEARLTMVATRRAIEALEADLRTVVMIVLIDGKTYREAAAILGVPIGTVMSRLSRARAVLEAKVFGT